MSEKRAITMDDIARLAGVSKPTVSRALNDSPLVKQSTKTRGQGFIANIVASTLVIGASLMGSPVSTTHVSTGSIFGIGRLK